jgi:hypothetical protein
VKATQKYRAVLESLQQTIGYRAGPIAPPGDYFPLSTHLDKPPLLGSFSDSSRGRGGVKTPQTPAGEDVRVYMPKQGASILAGDYIDFIPFTVEPVGQALQQIPAIAAQLAGKRNKIEICGHSSSRPLPADSPYDSLLELSYERARIVYDALLAEGIEPERIRVVAFADHLPLPASHDAHELHEDRVEVQILDTYINEYIGPNESSRKR